MELWHPTSSEEQPKERTLSLLVTTVLLCLLTVGSAGAWPIDVENWILVRSPHFALYTNAGAERSAEIVLGLERFRAVFAQLSPSLELKSPTPTKLFAFRDGEVYAAYKNAPDPSHTRILGQFISQFDACYITLDASALQRGALGVIQHEYVHYFVRHNFPRVPLWFNEGLAEYYSTFTADAEAAKIGRAVEEHHRRLREAELDLRQVLQVEHGSSDGHDASRVGGFYATSWGLMHYLLASGERLDQTADYLLRLHQGEDPESAFEEAFGGRLSRFENALREYLSSGELAEISFPVARLKTAKEVRVRSLAPAETLYHLGDLLAHIGRLEAAESHFQLALDHHPDHPETLAGLAWIRDAQQRYEEATWLHREAYSFGARLPQNQLAYGRHLLIRAGQGEAPEDPDESTSSRVEKAIELLLQAVDLAPQYGEAYALLGQAHLMRADGADGVQYVQRARALLPARDDLVLIEVKLHMKAGQMDAASQLVDSELAFRAEASVVEEVRLEIDRWRWLHAAQKAFDQGEIERALELFDQAITATSDPVKRERMEEQLAVWQERLEH